MTRARPPLLALALGLGSCFTSAPSDLAPLLGDEPAVLMKSLRLPTSEPWATRFAQHTWFDLREAPGAPWVRVEIPTPESGVEIVELAPGDVFRDRRWERPVRVRMLEFGPGIDAVAGDLLAAARAYDPGTYRAWPGPNSNTFCDAMLREVQGLRGQLHHNAVGKDHGWRVGESATGLGVELETPLLGLQLGLLEGVELHLLGLTLGVGLQPLALRLPFLPALEVVHFGGADRHVQ